MVANIKPKSNQDVFDKVLKAIRKQKYTQSIVGYSCKYRGPNGLRCAAGHLIPNSLYKVRIEGTSISGTMMLDEVKNYLIQFMQFAHDNRLKEGSAEWELGMKEIASDYNLIYTEPSKEIS
jgi:hypothetical protein